jgi:hypothetical protein
MATANKVGRLFRNEFLQMLVMIVKVDYTSSDKRRVTDTQPPYVQCCTTLQTFDGLSLVPVNPGGQVQLNPVLPTTVHMPPFSHGAGSGGPPHGLKGDVSQRVPADGSR